MSFRNAENHFMELLLRWTGYRALQYFNYPSINTKNIIKMTIFSC